MDEELKQLAERLLSEARRTLEQGTLEPYLKVRGRGPDWHHIDVPRKVMDSGAMRGCLFDMVREGCDLGKFAGVILVCDTWAARLTEEGLALARGDPSEFHRLSHIRHFEELVKQGLAVREQAIEVIVQTPEACLVIHQGFQPTASGVLFGERHDGNWVEGRMRMWGSRDVTFAEGALGQTRPCRHEGPKQ